MTVPSALRCSATNVENNLPLMWKMKGINLPLNIALKEDFVMILLFSFRKKPWYFYELEDSKERTAWVWVEKKKWVPFRARSLRDDQTWNRRPFITFWISCDVEQAKNKLQYCCPSRHGHGLQELDPQASTLRKARKLLCWSYISLGPNAAWHVHGYDKLKP